MKNQQQNNHTYWLWIDYKRSVRDKLTNLTFDELQSLIKKLNTDSEVKCLNYGRE